ncbi:MAG TPA: PEP/pyruvate-binding domain-containing protein [Polyangiaceae bacterium]|jgi:pyruvate,water dikinase|nr:PEP/pyruvate-binding domain-containing protein [Polyangiaceae bacterium]
MSAWLVPLEAIAQKRGGDDPRVIGGKAARLVWLVRHGFDVPQAVVLPAEAFSQATRALPPSCEPRALLRAAANRAGSMRAAEARQRILGVAFPEGLQTDLDALWATLGARSPWGLAVRSSATCEDGALVSMAGLAETVLGVRGPDELAVAVRQVWASLASERALAYLAAHGVRDVGMGVVLQTMVQARAAGVMFTRAPDARARGVAGADERIVNAGLGLGAPVVNGVTTPDVLRIDSRGRLVETAIAHKARATVVRDGRVQEIDVEAPDTPALGRGHIAQLAAIAVRLEEIEPVGWDVEFACDEERTWIVQARRDTGRGFPAGGSAETVWSNVNVGEALPGVATPFTWSVAGAFSEAGFRRAFAALGCRVPRNARLVGNVHGRIYLNLTHFMRIAAQVPFLDPRTLVELGGGWGGDELATQVQGISRKGFYFRLPLTASRLLREHLKLDDEVEVFEAFAERQWRAQGVLDLAILPDEGVARRLRDIQTLLERTGNVMLTCASSTLGTHIILKTMLERVAPVDAEHLTQSLTSGIRDVESARPGIGIMHVAALARREPEARAVIEAEATTGLDAIPEGAARRALQSFIERYGDRAVREAELSTPRWKEDPRPVLRMLRAALRTDADRVDGTVARAKAHATAEMERLLPRLNAVEQTIVRHLVGRAQRAARLRERMRSWVTRVLGMLREAALDADRRLLRGDPDLDADWNALAASGSDLANVRSAFFLTIDELVASLRAPQGDLAPLVRARRAEFARDLARPDPPATFVGAPPPVLLPPSGGTVLRGLPASPGVVEGRARVILREDEMDALQPGEILVVHTTDVGWTPLFLVAAGVVSELGGPLSHAAVVAREFGVPSVVNVMGATRAIRPGDVLRVDGDRGTVERIR